jgi:glycerophosphoryl diester phosphodiesterase
VPLLADVFDWARERAARVNVELKSDVASLSELVDAVVRDVRRAGALPELVFFSSFHPWLVRSTAAALPAFCSCWLVHAKQQAFRAASLFWSLGAVGVNPEHVLVTQARMTRWQHAGALVNTWTVNEPARAIELSELGVDAIISDTPGAIVKALGRQSAGGAS